MSKIKLGSKSSLYPYPATILSVEIEGKKNFMQVGFMGIVNANPGMIGMGVGKHHYTTQALKEGEVIAIAIADEGMLIKADYVGIRSGDKVDKSDVFETIKGDHGSNLIEEAPINLEVKILKVLDLGGLDYTIIGEILEVYAEESIMTGKNPDIEKMNPLLLSMYDNRYFKVGEYVGSGWRDGLEYEKIKSFVVGVIFKGLDELTDNDYFAPYMTEESQFEFEGKRYQGYSGFCNWLDATREVLEAEDLQHTITKLDVKKIEEDRFKVAFVAEAKGQMKTKEKFHARAEETWILRKENENYVIESYIAK